MSGKTRKKNGLVLLTESQALGRGKQERRYIHIIKTTESLPSPDSPTFDAEFIIEHEDGTYSRAAMGGRWPEEKQS